MKTALIISLLSLGAAGAVPAAADPEPHQHQHGQPAQAEESPEQGAGGGMMGGGMMGRMGGGMKEGGRMGGGMMHGRMRHCDRDEGNVEALKDRIRQLEKRLDLMQTTLELLAGRQGGGCSHHCGQHGRGR